MIYIIYENYIDDYENNLKAAYYQKAIGYVDTEEEARLYCKSRGEYTGDGWPLRYVTNRAVCEYKPLKHLAVEEKK